MRPLNLIKLAAAYFGNDDFSIYIILTFLMLTFINLENFMYTNYIRTYIFIFFLFHIAECLQSLRSDELLLIL